ncbi:MAG: GTP-binding protein [Kofleriaceae bacterium]
MAVVDAERSAVVIRIVYDGPPHAGKTTSVRALARSLMRSVDTPRELEGRTLFFDWLEYTGGLFEGHQIRCQIVSVPGQPELAARRRALLESADVVVFVADSSDRGAVARSVDHIRELQEILGRSDDQPVGVIVQANKRDVPGAVPRDELRAALGEDFAHLALTESVAEAGSGIRETFVFAVRLALDRIRELVVRDELPRRRPAIDSAEELLAALERLPPDAAGSEPERAPLPPPLVELAAAPPNLPDTRVPAGAIWPPVEGRMILHEAAATARVARRLATADWVAGVGTPWRIYSSATDAFDAFDPGRRALVAWAREHAAHGELLSPSRCIVLAETGDGAWRLWQIVRIAQSLRSWLVDSEGLGATELADRLARAAALLGEAHVRYGGTRFLPTLDSIGRGDRGPQYVWLMPRTAEASRPLAGDDIDASVARELAGLVSGELSERRAELVASCEAVAARGRLEGRWAQVVARAVFVAGR